MQILNHANTADFLLHNEDWLLSEEVLNNLILGLSYNLKRNCNKYGTDPPLLLSVLEEEQSICCAIQTPPQFINVSSTMRGFPQFIRFLCTYLADRDHTLPGVFGTLEVSDYFADVWSRRNKVTGQTKMNLMVHQLRSVLPMKSAKGSLRLAESDDVKLLGQWIFDFSKEIGQPNTMEQSLKDAQARISRHELFVWENQQVCSMAASVRPLRQGISINLVYTPLALRGRGYARSCVAALSEHLLKQYQFCTLFTDLKNPTSNYIYRKIGYRPVQAFRSIEFSDIQAKR